MLIIGINVYYLSTSFVGWLIHSRLPAAAKAAVGVIVFPLMAVYVVAVFYLMARKDTAVTFEVQKALSGGAAANDVPHQEQLPEVDGHVFR